MSKELVIGSNRHETKVAMLEDDQLVEIYFQRAQEYSLAGSIHKGRVTRVLPGMQSAFVDVGLERDTFLYVSDFFEENEDFDTLGDEKTPPKPHIERVQSEPSQDRRGDGRGEERSGQRYSERPGSERSADRKLIPSNEPAPDLSGSASSDLTQSANAGTTGSTEPRDQTTREQSNRGRADDDRDAQGRRSRRRRTRGRGFPENKYAQPGSGNDAPASTVEPDTETESVEPSFNRGAVAADVVVLPGESLAKYKRQPQGATAQVNEQTEASVRETAAARDIDPATIPDSVHEPSSGVDEIESSIEEHEELQPDASKGVHSEDIERESLADVKQPSPTASRVQSISIFADDADVAAIRKPGLDLLTPSIVEETQVEASELPMPSAGPSEDEVAAIQEAAEAAIRNKFTDIKELPSSGEAASPSSEDSDALLAAGTSETEPGDEVLSANDPDTETTPNQSASVREQGGRFLQHRSGRRMRRRRGGNRFGQNAPAEGGEPQATPAVVPAVEPELRAEPREQHREPREQQREFREPRAAAASQRSDADQRSDRVLPSITDLLKPGQEIIVQIAKEPLGQKGARITSHVALPGRYVVFMPSVEHLGVSRKIASDDERQRLKRILQKHRVGTTGGFIVRTAGEGHSEEEIGADMSFLYNLWLDIRQKAEKKPAPLLLHHDLDVVQRILRDHVTEEYKSIWVDSEEMYESILRFVQRFQPALVSRVKMYTRSAPVFDAFNITQELEKALHPKVWLKSGGYIVINQTEALVAIDINTGKYVGKSNRLEDTIVKTNIEAVKEIVRQIRLRDLGGIIVVDFIDMDERKNRQKVMQALEEAMRSDKAPNKILQFNDFGLVAITRKRVKQSLERTLCAPCPYCEGAGYVKSVQTIISEILVEAQKLSKAIEGKDVVLRVHPDVAKVLKANTNQYLEEIEGILGRPVLVSKDNSLHHEKFDLA